MANQPALSVVVPNYNHARVLPRALDALLSQSLPPLEIIVVDDGSTDDSRQVLGNYAREYPLVRAIFLERNRGVAAAVRRGIDASRGDCLYLAGADDEVVPGFFAAALSLLANYPQAGMVFGRMALVDPQGGQLALFGASAWQEDLYAGPRRFLTEFLEREAPDHSLCGSTIYRTEPFLQVGGYREELGHWMDTFAARAIGLRWGTCHVARTGMNWYATAEGLARGTPLEVALRIADEAARLMRSPEFADSFPADYVNRWERRYRVGLFHEALRRRHAGWGRWLEVLGRPGVRVREWLLHRMARRASRGYRPAA